MFKMLTIMHHFGAEQKKILESVQHYGRCDTTITMTRIGPKPLPVHLGLAATTAGPRTDLLQAYLAGIQKYQLHPYQRTLSDLPEIWRSGEVTLRRAAGAGGGVPLLVIPSMINRAAILDLTELHSFVRWMAGQGRDVILLDWGNSLLDAGQADMDLVVMERLIPAAQYLANEYGGPVHAAGYCMGGTLLTAAASREGGLFDRLVFLATPWDFDAGDRAFQSQVLFWAVSGQAMMAQKGHLPSTWLQTVFACLDPQQMVQKYADFSKLAADDPRASRFVAVEDWLNDPVDLPGGVAKACIHDWYEKNVTKTGDWKIGGKAVLPQQIENASLIVAAANDRLVPPECSAALGRTLPSAQILSPQTGHIGLLAGTHAIRNVWMPISEFLG